MYDKSVMMIGFVASECEFGGGVGFQFVHVLAQQGGPLGRRVPVVEGAGGYGKVMEKVLPRWANISAGSMAIS